MKTQSMTEPMPSPEERLAELKDERERALACAFLSLTISLALVFSNFPGDRKSVENARNAIAEHTRLLADIRKVVDANEQVLAENQRGLAEIHKAAAAH